MGKLSRLLGRPINALLGAFGCEVRRKRGDYYLHEYASYEDYKATQVFHNKRKIAVVWADEPTLDLVIERVRKEFGGGRALFALCHGTRNGFEQNYIAAKLELEIVGTDISDTATQFPRSVQWDFHDRNEGWIGRCDFIYTNSLDQSWKPRSATATWLEQLKVGGLLFIEHTELHGPHGAGVMDPFGASPSYMPYILSDWFGHAVAVEIIQSTKANNKLPVWLFVVKRLGPVPAPKGTGGTPRSPEA
jgi:hypothetical protein